MTTVRDLHIVENAFRSVIFTITKTLFRILNIISNLRMIRSFSFNTLTRKTCMSMIWPKTLKLKQRTDVDTSSVDALRLRWERCSEANPLWASTPRVSFSTTPTTATIGQHRCVCASRIACWIDQIWIFVASVQNFAAEDNTLGTKGWAREFWLP